MSEDEDFEGQDTRSDLAFMNLDELLALKADVDAVADAGGALKMHGLHPVFDLSPGREITIRLGVWMPCRVYPVNFAKHPPSAAPVQTSPQVEAVAESPAVVEVAAAATVGHPDPQPEAAPDDEAGDTATAAEPVPVPESGDATGSDASAAGGPIAPAAPVAGSASALVASTQAVGWTANEDATAVQVAAHAIQAGLSKTAAYAQAAAAVRRPVPGTTFRLTHKLADRLRDAVLAPSGPCNPPPAPPEPAAVEPAPAAVVSAAAGEVAETAPLDPLEAHLVSLKPSPVWTPARDLTMLQLAIDGWKPHEIAEDLGVVVAEVNKRFDLLTGLDRETKQRRFKREDVLRALRAMHATGDA